MAVIENDIQYNWVRKRVENLKEKVDENTPTNNPCRIELELLSKLEKEYSEEHASVLESDIEDIERKQINVYKGLPIILEKVKSVALSAVIGKSNAWLNIKLNHNFVKGKPKEFIIEDLQLINKGLQSLSEEISQCTILYSEDREDVIRQIKVLSKYICMPYIYLSIMKQTKPWYEARMLKSKPERRMTSFKENDIHAINKAAMQIANELKSTELIL